jgi:hypothetical protein
MKFLIFCILLLSAVFFYSNARPLVEYDPDTGERKISTSQQPGDYFNTGWNFAPFNDFMHEFTKNINYYMKSLNGK